MPVDDSEGVPARGAAAVVCCDRHGRFWVDTPGTPVMTALLQTLAAHPHVLDDASEVWHARSRCSG